MALRRIAITFNGSLPRQDLTAAKDRSFVRELQPLLLNQFGFDAFYRLDDECKTQDARSDVFCFPPTLRSLKEVINKVTSKFVKEGNEVAVFIFVNGHGSESHKIPTSNGYVDGRDFAKVLNQLPSSVSRITNLNMCYAGGYATFHLVDENDLLKAYSGKDEVNWWDASGLGVFEQQRDPDSDGILTMQEAFWMGQGFVYNEFAPYRRRFVFLRGPNFVDRGFGTTAATSPFPASLREVPDVITYLSLTKTGAMKGVTVIGFEGREGGRYLKRKLEEAAAKSGGTTQFLWVPQGLAFEVARPEDVKKLKKRSLYKVFYHGSDESLSFIGAEGVNALLKKLYEGKEIRKKK